MRILADFIILAAALVSLAATGQSNFPCRDVGTGGYRALLQSPIELSSYEAFICDVETELQFYNYNRSYPNRAVLTNNGHTVNIKLPEGKHASISGGPLGHEQFNPVSVHLHWGERNSRGTEHVLDSHSFSMELHIVHASSDSNSLEEAVSRGRVAVVAILIQEDPSLQTEHVGLAQISRALRYIQDFNSTTEIDDFTLSELMNDENCANYFNYPGSLTTPPYSGGVNWIVCALPVPIPTEQLLPFLTLRNHAGELILGNFRGLQPRANRRVCRTYVYGNCGRNDLN